MFIGGVPTKRATHTLAGRSQTSSGVPTCSNRPSRTTATRCPSASASPWSCVTCRVVTPVASCTRRISPRVETRSCASRFESGSSSSSTRGRAANARANATRCRSPPESSPGRRSSNPSSRSASAVSRTRSAITDDGSDRARSPNAMLRSTLRCGNRANDWKTIATPRRDGSTRAWSAPSISTRPPSKGSSPAIARSNVDLPDPDAPSTATSSPGATESDSPRSASTPP